MFSFKDYGVDGECTFVADPIVDVIFVNRHTSSIQSTCAGGAAGAVLSAVPVHRRVLRARVGQHGRRRGQEGSTGQEAALGRVFVSVDGC